MLFRGQPYSRSKIIVIIDMRFEYATSVFIAKANATNPNKVGPVLFGPAVIGIGARLLGCQEITMEQGASTLQCSLTRYRCPSQ